MREELLSGKDQEVVYHVDTYTDSVSHTHSRTAFFKLLVIYCLPIRVSTIGIRIYTLLVQQMYISYVI